MKLCITYPNTNLPNSISQKALTIPPRAKTTYNVEYNVELMENVNSRYLRETSNL